MAAGDRLLDASGNRILDASGNIMLSNGAGDDCCCVSASNCVACGCTIKDNLTVVLSSIDVHTGVCISDGPFSPQYLYSSPSTLSGIFTVTRAADVGPKCNWSYEELTGTTVVGARYSPGAGCSGTPVLYTGFSIDVFLAAFSGPPTVSITVAGWDLSGGIPNLLQVTNATPTSGNINLTATANEQVAWSGSSVIGKNGTVSLTE